MRSPDPTLGRLRPVEAPKATIERVPGIPAHMKASEIDAPTKPKRQRVVLADPATTSHATALRGRVELAEQTSWGEMLVRDLVKAQLRAGMGLALLALVVLAGMPLAFRLAPGMAAATVGGVPIAWLLVGIVPFPLLVGLGLWYHRLAERHERSFVDMVEN